MDFAINLGLKPSWIQRKTAVHFDLNETKYRLAVSMGAHRQDFREHGKWLGEHRVLSQKTKQSGKEPVKYRSIT